MQILVPHYLHLKLFALRSDVVAEVSVVGLHGYFAHQLLDCHRLDIRDRATSTSALAAIETRFIITTNIFEH